MLGRLRSIVQRMMITLTTGSRWVEGFMVSVFLVFYSVCCDGVCLHLPNGISERRIQYKINTPRIHSFAVVFLWTLSYVSYFLNKKCIYKCMNRYVFGALDICNGLRILGSHRKCTLVIFMTAMNLEEPIRLPHPPGLMSLSVWISVHPSKRKFFT